MAKSSSERLRFTTDQFMDALCKICAFPDNPRMTCREMREGRRCGKCTDVARITCKRTSL